MAVISASILDADFARLRSEVERVADAGVDAFSLDVVDGRFGSRITFAEEVVARVREWTHVPIEVHLAVDRPERWIQPMCDAGADLILFHLEATDQAHEIVERIRAVGRCVGVAVKKDTPLHEVSDELLRRVDVASLLCVPVGLGGAPSAPDTFERIAELRRRADSTGANVAIGVDGGVKPDTAATYVAAGADMLTVGTGIYHSDDPTAAVRSLVSSTAGPPDAVARARLREFLAMPSRIPIDRQVPGSAARHLPSNS